MPHITELEPTAHIQNAVYHLAAAQSQYDMGDRGALVDALANLTRAKELLAVAEDCCVQDLRHDRATWQEIADVLGVTRSAAQQRFRHVEP